MPHINRIRVNNVKYNFGTQYYDDFIMRFSGKNTIYDLANGGGKSVLMLLLLQNLIPNCTLDEKQPIEKLFRSGCANTTIHSLIEWKLNPCHVRNGFQYMTTGFCARKAKNGAGEEEGDTSDRTSIDYFNYCIFYRQFNDNDLKNLPLSNGKERITYLGLRSYLQELEKKDLHVEVHIFDRKGDYQRFISNYGLFESEWEIIRGINKTEGHVRTYFETNYRTTRKVVEDLLIEEIIEKSFYHKTGTDREAGGMANTLLDLKDQLVLLSQKKSEIHYYDRQMELLSEFASRVGSLQGMYLKKQGLEEQLVKTYNTTLNRNQQKEHAHEALILRAEELEKQKEALSRQIDSADIQKREQALEAAQKNLEEKEKELQELSEQCRKKRVRLEERECDNHYLNYLEYEKEYLIAKKSVEAIMESGQEAEEELFAMANELKLLTKEQQLRQADRIEALQEQSALLEEEKAELEAEEKELEISRQVLENEQQKLQKESMALEEEMGNISRDEGLLFFSDRKEQYQKAEKEYRELQKQKEQFSLRLEQCRKEQYGLEIQGRVSQTEENRITSELESYRKELEAFLERRERMDQLISIYGGTYESVENILFQRQKELILTQKEKTEEKLRLQKKLQAVSEGIPMAMPEAVNGLLEDIARYYDEKAISGYEYLRKRDYEEREILLQRYPMLPFAVLTDAELGVIAEDPKLREKEFGDCLIPVISKEALERERELHDETVMIFTGKNAHREKISERLAKLEEVLSKIYEKERVFRQDYNEVQAFLKERTIHEDKEAKYEACKTRWKQLRMEREERAAKIRGLAEQENVLKQEEKTLEEAFKEQEKKLKVIGQISRMEEKRELLEKELLCRKEELTRKNEKWKAACRKLSQTREELENVLQALSQEREESKQLLQLSETFKDYVTDQAYPPTGLEEKELKAAFLGKKAVYEQKNADISDKQKLVQSYERAMDQQKEQLKLLGITVDDMETKKEAKGCIRTEMEAMLVMKKDVFESQNALLLLEKEKNAMEAELHRMTGSLQHARQLAEEAYGSCESAEFPSEQLDILISRWKERKKELDREMREGERTLRDLEEQCYALRAMAQDMERMMKSAGISAENVTECLETGMSLKEQYEQLRLAYERNVREEGKRLEEIGKEKQLLTDTLEKMGAYELSAQIREQLTAPENEQEIKRQMEALKTVNDCLELEKNQISKDMDSLQGLKDRFEAQCLQNCLNIKEELERLQKLSKISMDQQMVAMITLQIPYLKEELYADAMSEYIDGIIRKVEQFDTQAERLSFIRSQLAFKKLFSVIVTNMDAIRLTLYKRERMKEQSRYLKYEEAVGSTGQSQGIYIQFLVAIINYISSINSKNADPLELKKVIFIDNPFGAAKDIYIWEPIFKLLKANNVQLIVPARGATPAITGHFAVNYILGQKLIDGRQQTVVVDYRSQTEEEELEYSALSYEQETLQF